MEGQEQTIKVGSDGSETPAWVLVALGVAAGCYWLVRAVTNREA